MPKRAGNAKVTIQGIRYTVHIIHIRTRHVSFSILIGRNSVAEWLIVASTNHLNSDPK